MRLNLSPSIELESWQNDAIAAWVNSSHPELGARHGIFDVFTGAGKTVLAYACMAEATTVIPKLRFAIVVPTGALADQWEQGIKRALGLSAHEVGRCGGGRRDSLSTHRAVIYVINSAREHLVAHVRGHQVMLVVDECHRAGSLENRKIFAARTVFRLGLSATPQRDDVVDADGLPLPVEEQPHGKAIGRVCYRLTLKRGRELGMLPRYSVHHHRIELTPLERRKYKKLTEDYTDACRALERLGGRPEKYMAYVNGRVRGASGAQRQAAIEIQNALFRRKHWLYQVCERNRVARCILAGASQRAIDAGRVIRAMAFNERVGGDEDETSLSEAEEAHVRNEGATALFKGIRTDVVEGRIDLDGRSVDAVALEHSGLSQNDRNAAVEGFRSGHVRILVSVKALVEGIDVPDADLGLSVASTSSARQRIQTMGRILRAARDAKGRRLAGQALAKQPVKELHLIYVGDTVDAQIYVKRDWEDETGEAQNFWWKWAVDANEPEEDAEPPRPPLTEEESWERIKHLPMPQPWPGDSSGIWWTFRQSGICRTKEGPEAANGDEAVKLLQAAGVRLGRDLHGMFKQTPRLFVVLKETKHGLLACGKLSERLTVYDEDLPETEAAESQDRTTDSASRPTQNRAARGLSPAPMSTKAVWAGQEAELSSELVSQHTDADSWFDIVKRAFLAERDGDSAMKVACRTVLESRQKGRRYGVAWIDALEGSARDRVNSHFDPFAMTYPQIMDTGVCAYATGQFAVLRRCRDELDRRSRGRARLRGLSTALSILLGETRHVEMGGGAAF